MPTGVKQSRLAVFSSLSNTIKIVTDVLCKVFTETMSSQLTTLVPVFNGSNYTIWSNTMQAFFMSQGLWGYVNGSVVAPVAGTAGAVAADVAAWNRQDEMARGNLTLRLSPAIQQAVSGASAKLLWDAVKDRYGGVSLPIVYRDFKEAISIRFNPNTHPAPQFEKMSAAFSRLAAVTVGTGPGPTSLAIMPSMQALIAMTALPQKWENLIPIICGGVAIADLKLSSVSETVIGQYETETNRGQHKAASTNTAQKISAIKWKRENPRFNKQGSPPQPSGSKPYNQQQPFRQHGGRGSGKTTRGKGKGKQTTTGHGHVASIAVIDLPPTHFASDTSLSPPTTHSVMHIGLSGSISQTVMESPPVESSLGFYPSVNAARSLAERLNVPATVKTMKTLEQHFTDFDT